MSDTITRPPFHTPDFYTIPSLARLHFVFVGPDLSASGENVGSASCRDDDTRRDASPKNRAVRSAT